MKNALWVTDLHLDAVEESTFQRFLADLRNKNPDLLFISGDIAEKLQFSHYLTIIYQVLKKPIYFVLGNHDFYESSLAEGRDAATQLAQANLDICYLSSVDGIELTPQTGVIGHEGWADGLCGNFMKSPIDYPDYRYIRELKNLSKGNLFHALNELGKQAAEHLKKSLHKALKRFDHIILITHYPPYREACYYQGKQADDEWAPLFVAQSVGIVLKEELLKHPNKKLLVLCGHTHEDNDVSILPNLRVLTGKATVGRPEIQQMIPIS